MVLKEREPATRAGANRDFATVSRHEIQFFDATKNGHQPPSGKVRFAEDQNRYWKNPQPLTEQEISKRWYSIMDLKAMKNNRSKLVRDIIAADRQCMSNVTFQTVLAKIFEACCTAQHESLSQHPFLSAEAFHRLCRTLELCPSRVGMEWVAVPAVGFHQHMRRTELRRSLKSIQLHCKHMETEKYEECLRLTSESFSRPSRLYAALVATAHVLYDTK